MPRRASEQPAAPVIAIVDDEEAVGKALARLLRAARFRADTFTSCASFLERLAGGRPDCLILDLYMPGMSGIELLREMQARGIEMPTIVITAHDEPGSHGRCMRAGAAAYLRKPIESGVLLEAIAGALAAGDRPRKCR